MIPLSGWARAVAVAWLLSLGACGPHLTPEDRKQLSDLNSQLSQTRAEIEDATRADAQYSSGFIKTLIEVRLEILKTNAALIAQRINAIEGGARVSLVTRAVQPDSSRAAAIATELAAQKGKVAAAEAESAKYEGGLVKAMAEVAAATERSSLAMLEQQYLVEQYGIAVPMPPAGATPPVAQGAAAADSKAVVGGDAGASPDQKQCIKIDTYDSSVLSRNDVFVELAWKADVSNSCDTPTQARVTFKIYDKDEFELDSDNKTVVIAPHDVGKVRGKMLVSPPEKANRMAKQGVSVSAL